MQKINKSLFAMFLIFLSSNSFSEVQVENVDDIVVNVEDDSFEQEDLLDYISENVEFEKKKNKLKNQLELEKLKSEILKLKSDSNGVISDSGIDDSLSYTENTITYQSSSVIDGESKRIPPKLILVSDVGGVSAFGVSVDGKIKFVKLNSEFKDISGNKYQVKKQNDKYIVSGK